MDGNNLIYVDYGDTYPRTVVMHGNVLKKKEYNIFYTGYAQPLYYNGSIIWIDSTGMHMVIIGKRIQCILWNEVNLPEYIWTRH